MNVIGSADGPTSIMIAEVQNIPVDILLFLIFVLVIISIIIVIKLLKILPAIKKALKIYINKN